MEVMENFKKLLVKFSLWFNALPDKLKSAIYYALGLIAVQLLLAVQGKFGVDTVTFQIVGIILTEVYKWLKNLGVNSDIAKTLK